MCLGNIKMGMLFGAVNWLVKGTKSTLKSVDRTGKAIGKWNDDKFNKEMCRTLRDTIATRSKALRIASDPKNTALQKGATRHGGQFIDGEIHFPSPSKEDS